MDRADKYDSDIKDLLKIKIEDDPEKIKSWKMKTKKLNMKNTANNNHLMADLKVQVEKTNTMLCNV